MTLYFPILFYWSWKDWLALTFFPIEDTKELEELRELRSPFMMSIARCFQTDKLEKDEMKAICKQIVKNASSYINPNLRAKMEGIIFQNLLNETLKKEHKALEQFNIQAVLLLSVGAVHYDACIILTSLMFSLLHNGPFCPK